MGIISVKKTLRLRDIPVELEALQKAASLCRHEGQVSPYMGLFAFSTGFKVTQKVFSQIFSYISNAYSGLEFDYLINELTILDSFVIFKYRKESFSKGQAKYVHIDCSNHKHIAIQRMIQSLLGIYYQRNKFHLERPGFVSFEKGTFGDAPVLGIVPYSK